MFRRVLLNLTFGLLVCTAILAGIEALVRIIPESWIAPEARTVPLIAPLDRTAKLYRKNGFRGQRPCAGDCPENLKRIITIGGSSTYGVPMYHGSKTFSAYLQRQLDQSYPEGNYEVLNAGIAGFGIWQIVEALERHLLQLKPDMLLLCAWYNDSSNIPGWYGYPDLNDMQAYEKVKRLRLIESNALYQLLIKSRAYALARYLMPGFSSSSISETATRAAVRKKIRRANPDEFEMGLQRVIELAEQHNFRLVFILEALNRTLSYEDELKKNKYYRVIQNLADSHSVTLVDTLSPIHSHSGEWLFYDFIHPNEHGHRVIANAIFDQVFRVK